jgi:hypothetical protein
VPFVHPLPCTAAIVAALLAIGPVPGGAQARPPSPRPELVAVPLRTLTAQLETLRAQLAALDRVVRAPAPRPTAPDSSPGAAVLWCCTRQIFEVNASMDAIGTELARLRRSFDAPAFVERRALIAEAEVELARARRALEDVTAAGSAGAAREALRTIDRAASALQTRAMALDRLLRG